MRSFIALVRKDLKSYFDQPTGYILIVVFMALVSFWFFRAAFLTGEASLRPLFTVEFGLSLPWLLVLFVPAATMRLLAEEQRDGTLEILFTQPIRGWTVLLAKFMAGWIFVTVAILATIGIPIALATAGNLDEGAITAQYLGSLFLAAAFVAVGLFTSSLTRNQIIAFILGLAVGMALMLLGLEAVSGRLPNQVSILLQSLSPVAHFSSIARGVIDLRDVLYFIALVFTFLSAAYLMIRSKTLSHKSIQYLNLRLGVAGLIVFSLLVGWFGNSIGGRLDLTEEKRFTLSPGTAQILSELDDLLTIKVFESKDPPPQLSLVARDVNDFLSDFAASSDGKVKIVRRSPNPDGNDREKEIADEARILGVPRVPLNIQREGRIELTQAYLGLSMTYADQREVIPFIQSFDGFEYRLATLANKMVKQERSRVAFLTGHGEKDMNSGLSLLAGELGEQYEVASIGAAADGSLDLSGVDVLIIAGPTREIPQGARDAMHAYLDGGGKMMALVDPVLVDTQRLAAIRNRNSFADFVERYGVIVEDDLVFDMQSNVPLSFSTSLGDVTVNYPYWMQVPVVDRKVAGEVDSVMMPWASSLGKTESQVGRVEIIDLLETTPFSAIDFSYGDVSPNAPVLRQVTEANLVQSLMAVAVEGQAFASEGGERFRLVVVGDSDWLNDGVVSRAPSNLFLALNLVDWLSQEETLASVRSKVVSTRQLLFSSETQRNVVQYINIIGVPLAFVAIGILQFVRRRGISMRTYEARGLGIRD
jgi:ABC-2 type transport system permease protein